MSEWRERTELLLGGVALQKLAAAKVAVFGVGGVGGTCVEALARSGVGAIDLYDNDVVNITNLNRQIVALHSTIGRYKVEVMAERIDDINPACKVNVFKLFYVPETADEVDLKIYDYVIDAIDTVSGKIELIVRAKAAGVRVISSMGAGGKLDPMGFRVSDIRKTETDPLAKAIRKELRARGVTGVKAVWSGEQSHSAAGSQPVPRHCEQGEAIQRPPIPSFPCVPPACGLAIAAEVIKDLVG